MGYSEKYPWFRIERKFRPWLNDEEIEIVRTIRDYMQEKVKPRVWELEGAHHDRDWDSAWGAFVEFGAGLAQLGYLQAGVPEEYGGMGLSLPCQLAMAEEIGRVDISFSSIINKANWLSGPIFKSPNEVLKKMMMEKLCSGEFYVGAVCFTEPQGGVNIEDIGQHGRSKLFTAVDNGDEYVLNGLKIFPGPSGPAEIFQGKLLKGHIGYLVVANTEQDKAKRNWNTIGLFYVPPDANGLSFSKPYEKMGCTLDRNCEIYFDDVRIPKNYRVGGPGLDAALYYSVIVAGARLGIAARLTGAILDLLEKALEQSAVREIEGRPLREYSLWAAYLGEMGARMFASRAAYFHAAFTVMNPDIYGNFWDQDGPHGVCSGAKDEVDRNFRWVADRTMEIFGAQGYMCEFGVEKCVRDGEMAVLAPGGPQREKLDTALCFFPRTWSGVAPEFERWKPQTT
ncbi:MAG: acyl-CoA/acyl-ACP dehydrogenase [Desulfobacteraceae bacterium]|nr:acyl-CoA/acyl-ACP dehydrogenase [Desulfobacteraceae bacterium]